VESRCVREKRNSIFACAPEESGGSNLEQKTGQTFKADVHSTIKSCSNIESLVIAKCSHIFERNEDTFDGKVQLARCS
jgi:hypothetical protein